MISIKMLTEGALILFFGSMIWLPSADFFLELDRATSLKENRALARAPRLTGGLELVDTFPGDFEQYFNDHFGFRNTLIKGNSLFRYHVFGESGSSRVLIGKDGWLFLASRGVLDCYRGVDPFTSEELEAWRLMLEARRDALAERGIRYLFLFVPNKHTVYPEMMPDRLNVVSDVSRLDQLTAYLSDHSDVEFLDLRETLIRGKRHNQTFERTGTHWNAVGRYFAQAAVVKRLAQWFPELKPLTPLDLESRKVVGSGQDLARMLGMEEELQEEHLAISVEPRRARKVEIESASAPVALRGRIPDLYVGEDPSLPRLMLVGDSFGGGLMDILAQCFSRATYVRHEFDLEAIDREKPDVVINQIAERVLMVKQPEDMRRLRSLHRPARR